MLEDPPSMGAETAMDEVTDLIANIEMHRWEIQKEAGLDASRNYALGRLQLALLGAQEESRLEGPSTERLANTEALAVEMRRVETLARATSQRPASSRDSQGPLQESSRGAQRKPLNFRGNRPTVRPAGR